MLILGGRSLRSIRGFTVNKVCTLSTVALALTCITASACTFRNFNNDTGQVAFTDPEVAKPLILMYHEITNESEMRDSGDVSTKEFQAQMDWLKQNEYVTHTIDELYTARAENRVLPGNKNIFITFDDGYKGNYTNAFPIMKNRGLKATFFVHTRYVGAPGNGGSRDHASWAEWKEMEATGLFKVYSHTVNHPQLAKVIDNMELDRELIDSKKAIEEKLGHPCFFIAYPSGSFDARVIKQAKAAGYKMGLAVGTPNGDFGQPSFALPRIGIGWEVKGIDAFKKRMGISAASIDTVDPQIAPPQPAMPGASPMPSPLPSPMP